MAAGGLFVKQRAVDFFNHIDRALVKEIIETPILLYKVAPDDTSTYLYGESDGKRYFPAVQLHGLVNASPEAVETAEFGPDATQTLVVAFNRELLRIRNNTIPEVGDIMEWNSSHYEITNVDESRFPGGQIEWDFQYVCYAHMARQSMILIDNNRFGKST